MRSKSFVSISGYALAYVTQHPQSRQTNTRIGLLYRYRRSVGSCAVRFPLHTVCNIPEYRIHERTDDRSCTPQRDFPPYQSHSVMVGVYKMKPRKHWHCFGIFNLYGAFRHLVSFLAIVPVLAFMGAKLSKNLIASKYFPQNLISLNYF